MGDNLRFLNHTLITCGNTLSLTCCDEEVGGKYFEAIPCSVMLPPRVLCIESDQCDITNRKYINSTSRCNGSPLYICECQQLVIDSYAFVPTSPISPFVDIEYDGVVGGTATWGSNSVTFSGDDGTWVFDFDTYTTLNALQTAVSTITGGIWFVLSLVGNYHPRTVNPDTLTFTTFAETHSLESIQPGLIFEYDGQISVIAEWNGDYDDFRDEIETVLQAIVGADLEILRNTELDLGFSQLVYEFYFGNSLCDGEKPRITIWANALFDANPVMHYGEYEPGTVEDDDLTGGYLGGLVYYNPIGSGNFQPPCPYDGTLYGTLGGYPHFPTGNYIACCPQRGTVIGPIQYVSTGIHPSGYCSIGGCVDNDVEIEYDKTWQNLENVVVLDDGQCYSVSPNYFVFGKPGRLHYDYHNELQLFVKPDCNFTTEGCEHDVPSNCNTQLFLPMFHKDIPWGPFGSYYNGIENAVHLAWTEPYASSGNYLYDSDPFQPRYGLNYRPRGWIKTHGSWTRTEEITVQIAFNRAEPFYIGTGVYDDFNYGIINSGSVPSGLILESNSGSGILLRFYTSDFTIGDFVDKLNAITTSGSNCSVFAFCPGSEDVKSIPAHKIINTSAELFTQWLNNAPDANGGDGPLVDDAKRSGSDILAGPRKYTDLYRYNPDNPYTTNVGTYQDTNSDITIDNAIAVLSPSCRLSRQNITKTTTYSIASTDTNRTSWWYNIPGKEETVIRIRQNEDPDSAQILNVQVQDRLISIYSSGVAFERTGYINTNRHGGSGTYTVAQCVADLNSLTFTDSSAASYNPIVATSGNQGFVIWLDDMSWVNRITGDPVANSGVANASGTVYNYSYREPLLNLSSTSILNDNVADLSAWVRRRCGMNQILPTGQIFDLPPCMPPNENPVRASGLVNCGGNEYHDNGWLVAWGCTSHVCNTEWYYKADRCPCDTVYRCVEGSATEVPHPYNQENSSNLGLSDGLYYIRQPTIYVCEYNFQPNCNVPIMIKVPFQIVYPNGFDGESDQEVVYQYGQDTNLPGYTDFCSDLNPVRSLSNGWCQHIWPDRTLKVPKEQIPKATIPDAYIVTRENYPICAPKPFNYQPEFISPDNALYPDVAGCDPDGSTCLTANFPCPTCGYWDAFENVTIVDKNGKQGAEVMRALIRSAISNLEGDDICQNGSCDRFDINCATACCECQFNCEDVADVACFSELGRINTRRQISDYVEDYTIEDQPYACELQRDTLPCDVANCVCTCGPTCACYPHCYPLTLSRSQVTNITKTETDCNCTVEPCVTATYELDGVCPGAIDCFSYINPPTPAPEEYCYDCDNMPPVFIDNDFCDDIASSRTELTRFRTCGGDIATYHILTDIQHSYCATGDIDACGNGVYTWNRTEETIGEGTSPIDSIPLGITSQGEGCGGTGDDGYREFTTVESRIGSFTINPPTYEGCSLFEVPSNTPTYETVNTWRKNLADFNCGYGSIWVTPSGGNDPRI